MLPLKDAYQSGANKWNSDMKKFSNDSNHVPACYKQIVRRFCNLKNPTRSNDGKGLDYNIFIFVNIWRFITKLKLNINYLLKTMILTYFENAI